MLKNLSLFLFVSLFINLAIIAQTPNQATPSADSTTVDIGYGHEKTGNIATAVVKIEVRQFNSGAIITPVELIIGKTSGLLITRKSGTPGSNFDLTIRGNSTLLANNSPLYVVDGISLEQGSIDGMRNPLNFINPDDIENFIVLKDAGSSAIYGGRASNGVILINTKRGTSGNLRISYESKISLSLPKKREVLSAGEFRSLVKTKYAGNSAIISMLGNSNTYWQDEIYKNALGHGHLLSFTGGIKKLPYRVSLGFTNQEGVLKTDKLRRFTTALNFNPRFFNDHLGIGFGLNAMHIKNRFADPSAITGAIAFDPTQSVFDPGNNFGGYFYWKDQSGKPNMMAPVNPLAKLNLTNNESIVTELLWRLHIDYKFHFLPELKLIVNYAYDRLTSERKSFVPDYAPWVYVPYLKIGLINQYNQGNGNQLFDGLLSYNKTYKKIDGDLNIMLGYSGQSFRNKQDYQLSNADAPGFIRKSSSQTDHSLKSEFVRVNFSLKQKYLFGFSFRRDGFSNYTQENRWANFPALVLGWNVHNEAFLSNSKIVSTLKLRAGYGKTGNTNIPSMPFDYTPLWEIDQNLKMESTGGYDAGLDYGFFHDRYYGSVNVYLKQTKDLINFIQNPFGLYLLTNIGDLENRGVEFSINTRPIVNKKWHWDIGLNFTYNENKITRLTDLNNNTGIPAGDISGGFGNTIQIHSTGYPAFSFLVLEQIYDKNGKPVEGLFVDRNKDGTINYLDRVYYHTPSPSMFLSLSNSLKIANWEFSFLGTFYMGNYVYNNIDSKYGVYEMISPTNRYLNAVTPDINQTQFEQDHHLSNYYVQNASYFRLNNLTIGYDFTNLIGGKWGLQLHATTQNLITISGYKGAEPEISNGIDYNTYPSPIIFMLGLRVSLH